MHHFSSRIFNLNSTENKGRGFCLFVPHSCKSRASVSENSSTPGCNCQKRKPHPTLLGLAHTALSRHSSGAAFADECAVVISAKLPETLGPPQHAPNCWGRKWTTLLITRSQHVRAVLWSQVSGVFSTVSQISGSAGKQGAEQLLEVHSSSFFIIEAVTNSRKYSALFKFRVEQGSRKQVLESNTKKMNQQQKQDIHLPIHSKSYSQPCCEDSAPWPSNMVRSERWRQGQFPESISVHSEKHPKTPRPLTFLPKSQHTFLNWNWTLHSKVISWQHPRNELSLLKKTTESKHPVHLRISFQQSGMV